MDRYRLQLLGRSTPTAWGETSVTIFIRSPGQYFTEQVLCPLSLLDLRQGQQALEWLGL